MGTILFVILRLAGLIDTSLDWLYLCALISIDSIGVPALIGILKKR